MNKMKSFREMDVVHAPLDGCRSMSRHRRSSEPPEDHALPSQREIHPPVCILSLYTIRLECWELRASGLREKLS